MQSKACIKDIINIVRSVNKNIQIEIQTRYYGQDEIFNMVDVVAYSISKPRILNKIKPMGKIQRYVLILTDDFNNYKLNEILNLMPKSVNQLTFKLLEDSEGKNIEFDNYIHSHRIDKSTLEKLREDINNYKGNISIRLDENCMDSINRYMIFREDGNIYESWDDYEKSSEKTYRKK